jgi:N6-L-threonylcarbamoyladenine synthase
MGGGVVANTRLRALMAERAVEHGLDLVIPPHDLCTDNGAMIASAGFYRLTRGERTSLEVRARPDLRLETGLLDGLTGR